MGNIQLRRLLPADKNLIYKWISDPELRKMTGTRGEPNPTSHDLWFTKKLEDANNVLLIIESEKMPVGIIGTNNIDSVNRNAEMYLYIGEKQEKGKGIATDAVRQFVSYLKDVYQLHKVNARIFSFNAPSIGLFEKCGFRLEGRLKEQIYLAEADTYFDLLWYSYYFEGIV